jgi:hypothetical protein
MCLAEGVSLEGKIVPLSKLNIRSNTKIICYVKGFRCQAKEAHFGGVVVQAI